MTDIRVRSECRGPVRILFLIGPGGVGKSTIGDHLARLLGWDLVDLDHRFVDGMGDIGTYIEKRGYDGYVEANSKLACRLVRATTERSVFVLSSGFLVTDARPDIVEQNRQLVSSAGYAILILPSQDIEEACRITVERQLRRGLGLNPQRERQNLWLDSMLTANSANSRCSRKQRQKTLLLRSEIDCDRSLSDWSSPDRAAVSCRIV